MSGRRLGWVGLAVMFSLAQPALAQDLGGTLTGSPGPGVPFVTETVLPAQNVRLQMDFIPVTQNIGTESVSDFIMPWRINGAWFFTESVVGEATLPFLVTIPGSNDALGERDGGFDFGNVKLGLEFAYWTEGGETHRLTFSWDMYIPFSQISNGDSEINIQTGEIDRDPQDLADAAARRGRYGVAATLLPYLAPEYLAETFTIIPGFHYRLKERKVFTHVSLDFPMYLGFDFSQPKFFHENFFGLRYGFEVGYDARPVYPTLEFTGVTTFAHDDPAALPGTTPIEIDSATALLATLGIRLAFGQIEPGVAVTYPITLGGDADDVLDPSVYIHFEFAYRFD